MRLVALLMILCTLSCGSDPIGFRPTIWVSDYKNERITHHKLGDVNCSEEVFNTFYHLKDKDFSEIVFILQNAKMPKRLQRRKKKLIRSILADLEKSNNVIRIRK